MSQDETWTPERVQQLKELHLAGKSHKQIAMAMGLTRNTICGRVHRMCNKGLLPRRSYSRVPRSIKRKETAKYGSPEHHKKLSKAASAYHRSLGRLPTVPHVKKPRTPPSITATKPTNPPKGIMEIDSVFECHGEVEGGGTHNVIYCAKPLTIEEREKGYRWCDWCRETKKLSYPYRKRTDGRPVWKSDWVVAL